VGLCIRSHPHAAREGISTIKPPIVSQRDLSLGVDAFSTRSQAVG
jgi:hypothetical protein